MCGIAGIVANSEVSGSLYWALYALQHRGQESGGISTYDNGIVHKYKGYGLVSEIFTSSILEKLSGKTGLGHVRYPTTGIWSTPMSCVMSMRAGVTYFPPPPILK